MFCTGLSKASVQEQFYQCSYSLSISPTVSQSYMKIPKPIHLINAHLPLSLPLSPISSHVGVDTWSPLWVMFHTHLNGLARLMDNNPLCFGLLCETLKSNLLADLLSRPAIAPPTSLPWRIVIVIECLGGRETSDRRWLGNFSIYWAVLHKRQKSKCV